MSILSKLKTLFASAPTNKPEKDRGGATMEERSFASLHKLVKDTRQRHALTSDAEAFAWLSLERILHLGDDAIKDAITHGPDDGGIDAVHIDHEGAQVVGCDYSAAHIVACDYADSMAESRRPFAHARLERLADTWVAIASNTDSELTLNSALRRRIAALHLYWRPIENDVPHQIYLVTNRKRSGIDRIWIEHKMDYFTSNWYHYFELADLVAACNSATSDPSAEKKAGSAT